MSCFLSAACVVCSGLSLIRYVIRLLLFFSAAIYPLARKIRIGDEAEAKRNRIRIFASNGRALASFAVSQKRRVRCLCFLSSLSLLCFSVCILGSVLLCFFYARAVLLYICIYLCVC